MHFFYLVQNFIIPSTTAQVIGFEHTKSVLCKTCAFKYYTIAPSRSLTTRILCYCSHLYPT